jgi:valyl-tRNA synthetase
MIMAGLEFTGEAPFRDIYITGLLRDKQGRKMSKSLGNGLDPLELVEEAGADALKFTLAFLCAQGQDIFIDKESIKTGSKFANKIWNASRYILMNLEGRNTLDSPSLKPADLWIYSRLNDTAKSMGESFNSYRYNDAAVKAYEYFWNDFCDWYVEATKLSMKKGDDNEKDRALTVLLDVLSESLKVLHPLMPFITEEIYSKLPNKKEELLICSAYPEYDSRRENEEAEKAFAFLQELVRSIRTLRSECTINDKIKLHVSIRVDETKRSFLEENAELVKLLAGLEELEFIKEGLRPQASIGLVGSLFEAFVYIAKVADPALLKQKFAKEIAKDRSFISNLEEKLGNEQFLKNAPPELVNTEKLKLEEALQRIGKRESYVRDL